MISSFDHLDEAIIAESVVSYEDPGVVSGQPSSASRRRRTASSRDRASFELMLHALGPSRLPLFKVG